MVSMTGVNGWFAENARSGAGIVRTGTKALEAYGRNMITKLDAFAASALRTTSPNAAANHDNARMNSTIIAGAARHRAGEADGRQPTPRPTPMTSAVASRLRARLAAMCPVSSDD